MELCYNLQTCSVNSSLEKDLALCAETGFQHVEIDFAKIEAYLERHSLTDLSSIIAHSGLTCATFNAIFDLNFCDETRWSRIGCQFDFACELGEALDCHTVIVLSSERADLPEGVADEDIFTDTVSILNKLADRGQKWGMKIAFEPVGTMAVGDIATAWEIIKAVNRPEVGLVVDDFNLYLWDLGADFEVIKTIDPEKIFIVHLNDGEKIPFAKLDQMHRCMPGDGRIDVVQYVNCLKASGYNGLLSVEVLNPVIWAKGPDIVIPEAYQKGKVFLD
ncbi:MAG: sugar phosphate isomerase/epimerase family protein [Lachnospiraceae bacterium]